MRPSRKAILCLCHDETILQLRQMLLEHFGYKVWTTRSVEDAKQIAGNSCPDMLLLDHNFPGIDTEEIAEQVKRVCPELIAVVLSPYFQVRTAPHGAVDRFVSRDEGPGAMMERIDELFQGKRAEKNGREIESQSEGHTE